MTIVLAAKFWDNLLCNSSRGNSLKHGKEEVDLGVRWREDMWETCLPLQEWEKGRACLPMVGVADCLPASARLSAGAQ